MKSQNEIEQQLSDLRNQYETRSPKVLGYPCNQDFQYPEVLEFLKYHINNVGSTFGPEIPYPLNSHELEREVIEIADSYELKVVNPAEIDDAVNIVIPCSIGESKFYPKLMRLNYTANSSNGDVTFKYNQIDE